MGHGVIARRVQRIVAGLLGTTLCLLSCMPAASAGSPPIVLTTASTVKRWVKFDFAGPDASGDIPFGKPLDLSIAIGGMGQGHAPLVAICESVLFQRQMVTLEPDPVSTAMKGVVTLEPMPLGKLSVIPKVARVQVTFARFQRDRLERVMTRVVYVTLDRQKPATEPAELAASSAVDENGDRGEEIQPDVEPLAAAQVVEEDLLPLPAPVQGRAYWQHISSLVSRSWSRTARRVRHAPSSETVRVRFRLYPSGRAQLIEIERGSGAREIDEAGIYAIVHAQPFPPFPDDMGPEPVDVHVRMRTGIRPGSQDAKSVTNPQPASAGSATVTPAR
jgi:TonB family protein